VPAVIVKARCLLQLVDRRINSLRGRFTTLLTTVLLPLTVLVTVAARGAEADGIQDVEWLRGIVYQQRPETAGQPIDTPGIWSGLPGDAVYRGGHLLRTPGNIESSQSLGIAMMTLRGQNHYVFELTSNFGGRSDARILDAVLAPAGSALEPCFIAGSEDRELVALLDRDEVRMVAAQQPSRMDQKAAVLVDPRVLVRFNSRTLRIERVKAEQVKCVGFIF